MPKLKRFSGKDVQKIFERLGFSVVSQRGSHVKLKRESGEERQIVTLPMHKELDRGTLKAIYNQARRFVPESELKEHFYSQ